MLSKSSLFAAALVLGVAGYAQAGHGDGMCSTFIGGHEPGKQVKVHPRIEKDAPYALTGYDRDGREMRSWPRDREIRVGPRLVGFATAN